MRYQTITASLLAAFIGLTAVTSAQARNDHDRDRRGHSAHQSQRDHAHDHKQQHKRHAGPDRWHDQARQHAHRDQRWSHAHQHRFQRGQRLPAAYRGQHYVVRDWRGQHLKSPPRGHQWVQVGGDHLLVAIATGVIAQLILAR